MVFNATFNNISVIVFVHVTVSFIGGGNQSTRRKPPTLQISYNVVSSTPRYDWGSNSQL